MNSSSPIHSSFRCSYKNSPDDEDEEEKMTKISIPLHPISPQQSPKSSFYRLLFNFEKSKSVLNNAKDSLNHIESKKKIYKNLFQNEKITKMAFSAFETRLKEAANNVEISEDLFMDAAFELTDFAHANPVFHNQVYDPDLEMKFLKLWNQYRELYKLESKKKDKSHLLKSEASRAKDKLINFVDQHPIFTNRFNILLKDL